MIGLAAILGPAIGTLIDRLIPDKAEAEKAKAEMELKLVEAANQVNLEQIKTNQIEAGSTNWFVASWRPMVGHVCAMGFAWAFIFQPIAIWILALSGSTATLPDIDTAPLTEMLFALLGLGGLRTFEKMKGVAR